MDLRTEAERLRLDLLAVDVSDAFASAGVPHALLKGPSTANWLYSPPRTYRDVDFLIPLSAVTTAVEGLSGSGVAIARAGGVGEEAEHSLLLHSPAGFEVDIHISLPTLPPAGDEIWSALSDHLVTLALDVGTIPALDVPGRCLVLALHALNSGMQSAQPLEDLRLARRRASGAEWVIARRLAEVLGAEDLFDEGIRLVEPDHAATTSARAYLHRTGAPSAALGLQRVAQTRLRDLPRVLAREVVPSRGFMRNAYPVVCARPLGLLRAHLGRWKRLLRELPQALRAWNRARRAIQ